MLIVPGRFHQQPPDQRVARARDATAPMLLPARVLARHQPEIRHQRAAARETAGSRAARPGSASPSTCRCPGSSATSRPVRGTARVARSRPAARPIPRAAPRCDRSPTDSRRRPPARRRASMSRLSSHCVRPRPVAPGVVQPAAQQQLAQPMATPLQIFARIITRPAQDRAPLRPRASAAGPPSAGPRAPAPPVCAHRGDSF